MADEKNQQQNDVQAAAIAAQEDLPASNIANWLQTVHHGTLSTLSTKKGIEGFPIGSIVPFALDEIGRPFILVADIAAHTRNINNSNEVCLFLSDPESSGDPQSHWRISVVGNMKRVIPSGKVSDTSPELLQKCIQVSNEHESILLARYRERVPQAESYLRTHNFSFYLMDEIHYIRYIAGFGKICWVKGEELLEQMLGNDVQEVSAGAVQHMNDDHEDSMIQICKAFHHVDSQKAEMVSIDSGGTVIKSIQPERYVYNSFPHRITADDMRTAIVDLAKKARVKLAE